MAAYVIFIRDKTTDAAELATYSGLAGGSMAGHKITPHVVYGPHEVLEGPDVEGVVVISFPDRRGGQGLVQQRRLHGRPPAPLQRRRVPGDPRPGRLT